MSQPPLQPARSRTLFQSGYLRQIAGPMLMGAVVLLISGVVLLGYNVSALGDEFGWVQRADDILLTISDIKINVVDDELAVRGYALTNDSRFLLFQKNEVGALGRNMATLSRLVAGDAAQKARFAQLKAIVARHTAVFAGLTALGPGHAADVASAITDMNDRIMMHNTRSDLDALRDVELAVLAGRQKSAETQAMHTYMLTAAIVILAFGFGLIGIALSRAGKTDQRNLARGS
jgi:CHASE3 domain sensor protein